MTTIILTHYDRFAHLGPEYIAHRVCEALNSIPRRDAFRWLAKHCEPMIMDDSIEDDRGRTTSEVDWHGHGFLITYDLHGCYNGRNVRGFSYCA